MKGLLFKDFLCLRKGMRTYILVTLGVLITAIAFVLSSQYGNMAIAKEEIAGDATLSDIDMLIGDKIVEMAVYFMLSIPLAFVANVMECFKEDARSGFRKPLCSMPLTKWEMAGSRFLTCIIIALISMVVSLFSALLIAELSEIYTFQKLATVILTASAGFLIYMSFTLFLVYTFGAGRTDFILVLPLLALWIMLMTKIMVETDQLSDAGMMVMLEKAKATWTDLMNGGYLRLFLLAAFCMGVSYVGSVTILKHRKGAI